MYSLFNYNLLTSMLQEFHNLILSGLTIDSISSTITPSLPLSSVDVEDGT